MPKYLAMSFEGDLAPSFDLHCLRPGRRAPDGWGIGYYPGEGPSAAVLKEPAPPAGSMRSEMIRAWEHLESSLFLLHIRVATWGKVSDANTQPFSRCWGARDWLFAHAGSLTQRLVPRPGARFEAVGSTDTEQLFCELLERIAERGWRSLGDANLRELRSWYAALNGLGSLTSCLTDGRDLVVYADGGSESDVYVWEVTPPYPSLAVGDEDLHVDLTRRGVQSRRGVIVTSDPLLSSDGQEVPWRRLAPGRLLVIRQGVIRAEIGPDADAPTVHSGGARRVPHPDVAPARTLAVAHRTTYRYTRAVERSTHHLRLAPAEDALQRVLAHDVQIHVDGAPLVTPHRISYEDVFANRVDRLLIDRPYTELTIESASTVRALDTDPLSFRPLRVPSSIPLVWMPWQRQVLQPYLLPPELPESELEELLDYAMSFVRRNDSDLLETLIDLNQTIARDFAYRPGATTMATTAFEVYARRVGVCQDFTNLFICMARLLGVPARYVCGYLHTGTTYANQRQAEASHAWLQVYLPEVGWRGFDPTNGVLTQTDHVRVAVGRTYVDATPTAGTIYVGGGGESLDVAVTVTDITA
ncbi:MAG: class II glutamine amidotransferase [Gemmatimonadaceae bacterium]|jgi:transglutaminase-like putative cysteine protease/predicted glutamine amidotransferase|nr:class II glutamine amidotransferase [Gemmatimonadaceae bacterium]